jgi:hypothetical protein
MSNSEEPVVETDRPEWTKPLLELADRIRGHAATWPSVRFRHLISELSSEIEGEPWQVLWAYFELATEPTPTRLRVANHHPRVLHGGLSLEAFVNLLERWSADKSVQIGQWLLLPPPGISFLRQSGPWESNDQRFQVRLLAPMPDSVAPYLVDRLHGTGRNLDINEDYNPLTNRMAKYGRGRHAWIGDYMHESIGDQLFASLVIDVPVPLAVGIALDHGALTATVKLRYRASMGEDSLEVRVGKEPWDPDRPTLDLQETVAQTEAWCTARFVTRVEEPGDYTVWVTRTETDEDFDWRVPIQIGDPDPLSTRARSMIAVWFGLNHTKQAPTLAMALMPQQVIPERGNNGRFFEVALHATCTALGLPTLYGDQTLTTPGVDILAFDRPNRLVFAISAVTDTNIDAKLTKWLAVQARVIAAVAPDWEVRPVIITSRPLSDCHDQHIENAFHKGVMVLGADDLECLRESPADFEAFGKTLHLRLLGRQAGDQLIPSADSDSGWRVVDVR